MKLPLLRVLRGGRLSCCLCCSLLHARARYKAGLLGHRLCLVLGHVRVVLVVEVRRYWARLGRRHGSHWAVAVEELRSSWIRLKWFLLFWIFSQLNYANERFCLLFISKKKWLASYKMERLISFPARIISNFEILSNPKLANFNPFTTPKHCVNPRLNCVQILEELRFSSRCEAKNEPQMGRI